MKLALTELYSHFIFITSEKKPSISEQIRIPLESYITKIVNHNSCKMCAIYANPEHVHFLIARCPLIAEETIATIIAYASSRFINNTTSGNGAFFWKPAASAFSVSKTEVEEVCRFILFQQEFHKELTFEQEYCEFFIHYQRTINLDYSYLIKP